MSLREDLEERVRKRGVRVEARLALLRLLLDHDAESSKRPVGNQSSPFYLSMDTRPAIRARTRGENVIASARSS